MSRVSVICFCLIVISVSGFNYSPKPNIVIREPALRTFLPKMRSSYFGFTINLRYESVFVGAPRAQSTLERQRRVNETGAIYKCSLQTQQCKPFVFDDIGNTIIENSDYTYDSEKKDNQWLGASMDGGPKENDRLVVCAPRRLANLKNDYLVHGICFWTTDTTGDRPILFKKISPLRLKTNQVKEVNGRRYFYHMFGEQGISVHLTENNEEIIIGAPGVHTWKGSIIRYRPKIEEDIGGLSRRDNRVMIRKVRAVVEYISEVPNPDAWAQANDSYFGYAVASGFFEGHDSKKLLYVATAPQANSQAGEAYLFDLIKSRSGDISIQKYYVFRGSQFGEYFGYSVITEDLNGDSLTDVIISAPQYAVGLNYEKGAVYVFMNKGNLTFEAGKLYLGKSDKPGRFGTVLSALGDINHDGFNDIAISAPFEDDGTVYIYLGSENGLRDKPSQILKSPPLETQYKPYMFGHGLSKGVDFDGNGFNDLAVGAPNAEAVLIYRAYPVVKIIASIGSESKVLSIDQNKFALKFCYQLKTTSTRIMGQMVSFKVSADSQVKRVKFPTGSNEFQFNETVSRQSQCRVMDANVRFNIADIFKPIELEMSYDVLGRAPDSESFCETCVAVDPMDPVSVSQRIVFSTGCKSDVCVADLRLNSNGVKYEQFSRVFEYYYFHRSPYVIGSTRTITIEYQISNEGETAYLPQINVTSSNNMPFGKIPSACIQNATVLLCDLNQGHPLKKGDKDTLAITFDTSHVEGSAFDIIATAFSTGDEENSADNEVRDRVILEEFSEVESVGVPVTGPLTLEKNFGVQTIVNKFEIRNNGPSRIKMMDIIISIPVSYKTSSSDAFNLIDFNSISINATHNNNPMRVSFYQNKVILIQNAVEVSSTPSAIVSNMQRLAFDSLHSTEKYPLEQDTYDEYTYVMSRRRRVAEPAVTTSDYSETAQLTDDLIGTFPANRTILFDCHKSEENACIQARLRVHNFLPRDSSVSIGLQYDVDLDKVNRILVEPKEFFIITTSVDVSRVGNDLGSTINLQKTDPHNIISKHPLYTTPIWVYIVSILGGLLLLVLISYGLYKLGFFRRHKQEELQRLTRQSQQQATEDEAMMKDE